MSAESLRSGCRRLTGGFGKASERLGIAHGDVGQDLAVQVDLGQLEAVDELAVRKAVEAGRRVDARDPQAAEVALAVAAVAVRVGVGLGQGLLGALVVGVRLAAEALRQVEGLAALLLRVDGALDAGHFFFAPRRVLTRGASWSESTKSFPRCRLCFGDFFSRMWLVKAWRALTLPLAVSLKRFFAPEWVFIFGMTSGPVWQVRARLRGLVPGVG